jgi:hypothetical protein
MRLFSTLAKAGIGAKLFEEARKPKNQAKIKQVVAQLASKASRRTQPSR